MPYSTEACLINVKSWILSKVKKKDLHIHPNPSANTSQRSTLSTAQWCSFGQHIHQNWNTEKISVAPAQG